MKTRSYFGQPPNILTQGPAISISGPTCRSFQDLPEVMEWLKRRDRMVDCIRKAPGMKICVSVEVGHDGTRAHASEPHRHRMHLNVGSHDIETWSCDNHLAAYESIGWKVMARLCQHCCTNEVLKGDICENCMDVTDVPNEAKRLKDAEMSYCKNKGAVNGCLGYTDDDKDFCAHCSKRGWSLNRKGQAVFSPPPRTKVRTILTSTRPCAIVPGCSGNMTATVRAINDGLKPELWWACAVCRAQMLAPRTVAIPDASTVSFSDSDMTDLLGVAEAIVDLPKPLNAETSEMVQKIQQAESE